MSRTMCHKALSCVVALSVILVTQQARVSAEDGEPVQLSEHIEHASMALLPQSGAIDFLLASFEDTTRRATGQAASSEQTTSSAPAEHIDHGEPVVLEETCDNCQAVVANCGCRKNRHWYVGVEATALVPNIKGRRAGTLLNNATGPTNTFYTGGDVEHLIPAPRIWVGLQGECWGVQFRYWEMNDSGYDFRPLLLSDGIEAWERLSLYTIDMELTRRLRFRCTDMMASVGVRYAEFGNQSFAQAAEVIGPTNQDLATGSVHSDRRHSGIGVTAALQGLRPIRDGNWNLFWSVRGSILWGEGRNAVQAGASVTGVTGSAEAVNGALAVSDESMFIGEMQLGVQRDFPLKCLPATAFFRAALEYQYWDAENNANSFAFSTASTGAGRVDSFAGSGDKRLDMYGIALATGFYW